MFQDIITKYTFVTKYLFVIIGYELITMDIVRAKLIDILLNKIIYVIILLIMSLLGLVFNSILCCLKYSPEEKEILKLIKAGDKMDETYMKNIRNYVRSFNRKCYMKKVDELLKEADRMDLWQYAFKKNIPEDPVDFVENIIQQYPEKKERKINKIKNIPFG